MRYSHSAKFKMPSIIGDFDLPPSLDQTDSIQPIVMAITQAKKA